MLPFQDYYSLLTAKSSFRDVQRSGACVPDVVKVIPPALLVNVFDKNHFTSRLSWDNTVRWRTLNVGRPCALPFNWRSNLLIVPSRYEYYCSMIGFGILSYYQGNMCIFCCITVLTAQFIYYATFVHHCFPTNAEMSVAKMYYTRSRAYTTNVFFSTLSCIHYP